ncbi:hypothetical protein HHI36_005616 [Cryptolaemus montrouzieri]|uniref:Major facilitator superfamily (MFS) profile domain-containing protein n=1 Tax=Cryptolaemus montrouzieri TaxID=559131 RepID=A0ABD2NVB2_9CUCU
MPGRKNFPNLSSAEAVITRVNFNYGRKKTPEEEAFTKLIGRKFDRKVIPVFFMTLWVGIVSHSIVFMIIFQHPKISRCAVPILEGHFSFEQILNLTVRIQDSDYGHYCYYDKRNYEHYIEVHGYDYNAIMAAISEAPNAYSIPCQEDIIKKIKEEFDDIGEVENFYDYLQLYCEHKDVKRMTDIALKYGQFLLSVPIGVIGDFYGRRTAFLSSGGIFTAGVTLTLIPHVAPIIVGRFLIGSSMILFYTVFVLFIESASTEARRAVALLLHEGIAIGRFLEYILYRLLKHWMRISVINAIMSIFMLIPIMFLNESPRWLYFRGNQEKAYQIIGLPRSGVPNTLLDKRIGPHFKNFIMPVFRKRVMIQMITIWCTSSVVFLIRSKFSREITNFLLKDLLDSGTLMGCCTVLTFILMSIIGRGRTIILFFSITSAVGAMLFFNPRMDKIIIEICLVISVTLTENATFFAFYLISEFYPNDFRFTGYGLCCGIHGFGDIFHFHTLSYKIPIKSLFYAPLFLISSISLASSHFQVETSGAFVLSDYPREAMRESDYLEIVKNVAYDKRKLPSS